MGAVVTLVLSLLSSLPGTIGKYFSEKQEIQKIKMETDRLVALKAQELVGIIAAAEAEKASNLIKATGPSFKYVTFFLWFGPFLLTLVYPAYGLIIFERLALMPGWYAESIVYIMMVIWGAQISQPVVSGIFDGVKQFFREQRIVKAATSPNVDNEALFELIRSLMPSKKLSQDQVDKVNDIISR